MAGKYAFGKAHNSSIRWYLERTAAKGWNNLDGSFSALIAYKRELKRWHYTSRIIMKKELDITNGNIVKIFFQYAIPAIVDGWCCPRCLCWCVRPVPAAPCVDSGMAYDDSA